MKARRKFRESKSHAVAFVVLLLLVAIGFTSARAVAGVKDVYDTRVEDLPALDAESFNYAEESYMYAADGTTLLANFQLEKRVPVELSQISDYVVKGTVDVEDIRFYEHNGVDPQGIMRALLNNLAGGAIEGASTITQQLVRNTALSEEAFDITLERKAREAELALALEDAYSKDEILTMYLNTINYGDGCYGIEAAANNYFQVSAADLSLAQAAALIGIPQSPTRFNPKENPEECKERRNLVLNRMWTAGDITEEEYDAAVAEELVLNPAPDEPSQGIYAYPYFTSFVRDELMKPDNKYHCSYVDLFEGGLTIYTTLDPTIQNYAEQACAMQYEVMEDGLDCALVAIDPRNGYVKAIVGGRDFYTDQWNVATQGGRPSGSTFKVFTLTAAIEEGIHPNTPIDCSNPVTLPNGSTINNFGYASYGTRTIANATAISSNTGYYRLADQIGAPKLIETAHRMGIDSELSPYPIITLGTENVTPLEMAEAYSTLASGGIHHDPVIITRIENKKGEVIYEATDNGERVLDERVAGAVTKVLRGVFESAGATAAGSGPSNGQPVAGKTGTGVDFRDHWLVGYCPMLTCACWIGNRDYTPTNAGLTANYLWHNFMSMACSDMPIEDFPVVPDPEYKNNPAPIVDETEQFIRDFKPGDLKEKDLAEKFSDYEIRISYEFSDKYEDGVVMSLTLDSANGVIRAVVSEGEDPAKKEEEERKRREEEERRQAEEEAARQAEEAQRQAEEEAQRQAEEEARRQAEEEARRQAEEEAQRQAEEAARQAEEEARRQAEEEARRQAEEEAARQAEEQQQQQQQQQQQGGGA